MVEFSEHSKPSDASADDDSCSEDFLARPTNEELERTVRWAEKKAQSQLAKMQDHSLKATTAKTMKSTTQKSVTGGVIKEIADVEEGIAKCNEGMKAQNESIAELKAQVEEVKVQNQQILDQNQQILALLLGA